MHLLCMHVHKQWSGMITLNSHTISVSIKTVQNIKVGIFSIIEWLISSDLRTYYQSSKIKISLKTNSDFGEMMMDTSEFKVWGKYDVWDRYKQQFTLQPL